MLNKEGESGVFKNWFLFYVFIWQNVALINNLCQFQFYFYSWLFQNIKSLVAISNGSPSDKNLALQMFQIKHRKNSLQYRKNESCQLKELHIYLKGLKSI
jgi:hypothetical protein